MEDWNLNEQWPCLLIQSESLPTKEDDIFMITYDSKEYD